MLVEAVNAPDGVIPGGLDNVWDDDENAVEVNLDQREGPLPPLGAAAGENEVEEENGHDQPEDQNEEEEEDISVSQTILEISWSDWNVILKPMPRVIRNIIGRFMFWGRNAQNEESSSEEDVPLDDTGVD